MLPNCGEGTLITPGSSWGGTAEAQLGIEKDVDSNVTIQVSI